MISVVLDSTITCPACGHRKNETMPTNACEWFYECEHCKTVLRPKPGDCWSFRSVVKWANLAALNDQLF